jgi:hypothetical protein
VGASSIPAAPTPTTVGQRHFRVLEPASVQQEYIAGSAAAPRKACAPALGSDLVHALGNEPLQRAHPGRYRVADERPPPVAASAPGLELALVPAIVAVDGGADPASPMSNSTKHGAPWFLTWRASRKSSSTCCAVFKTSAGAFPDPASRTATLHRDLRNSANAE